MLLTILYLCKYVPQFALYRFENLNNWFERLYWIKWLVSPTSTSHQCWYANLMFTRGLCLFGINCLGAYIHRHTHTHTLCMYISCCSVMCIFSNKYMVDIELSLVLRAGRKQDKSKGCLLEVRCGDGGGAEILLLFI